MNSAGDGAASDGASATPVPVPSAPTGLSASPNNGQVALSWTNPNNASIQKWQYQYKTTGGYGKWTDVPNSGASTASYAREQPEQQRHPHLQDPRGERQRHRSGVRRGVGHARGRHSGSALPERGPAATPRPR